MVDIRRFGGYLVTKGLPTTGCDIYFIGIGETPKVGIGDGMQGLSRI